MIPKNIFQSWTTIILHPQIQNKIDKIKQLNPDYTHKIYTDEEMDDFVNMNFDQNIQDCYNRLNIIVAKVDFWRYLILYKLGGVYLDMDSTIERPLDKLIKSDDEAIISAEGNPNFYVQWALIFNKNHPILKRTIEFIVENIKTNAYPNDIHSMTGPAVFSRAVNSVHNEIFGVNLVHQNISRDTNIVYKQNEVSYRIYGLDYNKYFIFKFPEHNYLYLNKKHWKQEQREKSLLKY